MAVERTDDSGGAVRLVFRGRATLAEAEECHAGLTAALAAGPRTVLDAAELEVCDVTFLQLLAAARRSAEARGQALVWSDRPAPLLRAAAETAGLTLATGEAVDARFWQELPG